MALDIEEVIARQRRSAIQLLEAPLVRAIRRDYMLALGVLTRMIDELSREIAAAVEAGEDATLALIERQRLSLLAQQVEAELSRLGRRAAANIHAAQQVAFVQGVAGAAELLGGMQLGVRLNTVAVERIAAAFATGSPLRDLALRYGPEGASAMRDIFVRAAILGQNPRITARQARKALGETLWRTLTTARTETLRAYRGAALSQYQANADILQGWVWVSAQDDRTCAACWAMHGSIHPLSTSLYSHPNCRCSMGPLPNGMQSPVVPGATVFERLPESRQLTILGPAKFGAYQNGLITLNDLVGSATHARWGPVRYERSLRSILGPQSEQFYRRAA